jgi:hypothetical protein
MSEVERLIQELAQKRFYGSVTLKFEAGRVVLLRKEETLKPTDLSEKPRRTTHAETSECE